MSDKVPDKKKHSDIQVPENDVRLDKKNSFLKSLKKVIETEKKK